MKSDGQELITQSEAAEIRRMSLAAVNEHVRSGRWRSKMVYDKRLVFRDDVINFEPKTHKSKHVGSIKRRANVLAKGRKQRADQKTFLKRKRA